MYYCVWWIRCECKGGERTKRERWDKESETGVKSFKKRMAQSAWMNKQCKKTMRKERKGGLVFTLTISAKRGCTHTWLFIIVSTMEHTRTHTDVETEAVPWVDCVQYERGRSYVKSRCANHVFIRGLLACACVWLWECASAGRMLSCVCVWVHYGMYDDHFIATLKKCAIIGK